MHRRQFLGATAASIGALAFGSSARAISGTRAHASRPPPEPVSPLLDAHCHVSSKGLVEMVTSRVGPGQLEATTTDDHVKRLDGHGIQKALVLSTAYMWASDAWQRGDADEELAAVQKENDFTAEQVAKHPDRLIAFASVNPKRDHAIDEIDRCVQEHDMRGLKLHLWNSMVNVRDKDHRKAVHRVVEHAADRNLPVLVHAFNGGIPGYGVEDVDWFLDEVVLPIPQLRVCWAHLGGAGAFDPRVQAAFERLVDRIGPESDVAERTFVDLSATLFARAVLFLPPTPEADRERMADLIDAWGIERTLWGSDNIQGALDLCRDAWPLSEDDWDVVCGQDGSGFLKP